MQLALVVVVFALCWCPLNLYHLLVDFGLAKANFNVFLVCHWIAMSSVCYNVSLMNLEHQNNNKQPDFQFCANLHSVKRTYHISHFLSLE